MSKLWEIVKDRGTWHAIVHEVSNNPMQRVTHDLANEQKQIRERYITRLYIVTKIFNLYAEYIIQNAGLDESQARIKIAGRNINNLRYADDTTLMAESKEELKSLLKVKEDSENGGLKFNIKITKITSSGPITSWQIDGETVADFILSGSKITVVDDYSHEIKRRLLFGRKAMTNLDSVLKSRDITLLTKCIDKAMVLPVVMYRCESWMIKKTEH